MKNKGIIIFLITFLGLLVIGITILFIGLLTGRYNFKNFKILSGHKEIISERNFNDEFNSIKIVSDISDIDIKNSNDSTIKVVVKGNKEKSKLDYSFNDNTLNINYKHDKCRFFCFNNTGGEITIYLPNGYDKDIDIKTDVGDIDINNINNIKIDSDTGDIDINNINNKANIKTDVGDIDIDNLNIKEDSSIISNVGDIKIKNASNIKIDAKTHIGDKKIRNNYKNSNMIVNYKKH